tara:strand:+ start:9563 stop:9787 length:225 start_codon:yes stop_codon:yes gene_type:complete
MDGEQIKIKIMPYIKLIKELKRGDKVFPVNTEYFTSWSGYRELLDKEYCNKLNNDKEVKNTKKKTKIDNAKTKE